MLIIVRHGRTELNAARRLLGRLDPALDPLGVAQAEAVATRLGSGTVRRVVSSPLVRARQTAEAIAAVSGTDVEIDERWIEVDYGAYDGMPLGEVPAEAWASWRTDPGFAPPGGESLASVRTRVTAACEGLIADVADGEGDVVVVTHVSPIKAAVCWTLGVDDVVSWRTFVSPGSITRVGPGPTGPVLHAFNETSLVE